MEKRKISKNYLSILITLVLLISIASSESFCPDSHITPEIVNDVILPPVEIFIKNKEHITTYTEKMGDIQYFHSKLYSRKFLEFLAFSDSLKRVRFHDYRSSIILYSRGRHRHIHDPVLFSILVSMFHHGDKEVLYYITEHGRRDYLNAFSEYIKPHLLEKKTFSQLPFYKLTAQEKELVLSKSVSVSIRAALGDTVAENKVISHFQNAKGFNKYSSAKTLSYIGTDKSLRTLASGLEDTSSRFEYGCRISLRLYMIEALADAYPGNCLFYDLEYNYKGDASYTKEELLVYARKLENWVENEFSIKLDIQKSVRNGALFLIEYDRTPRPRPF